MLFQTLGITQTLLLAFLGNHFLQVLGDNFSCHSVTNPDIISERRLLSQLAPELSEDMILRLVASFHDLRFAYESGRLTYPYSLRGKVLHLLGQQPVLRDLYRTDQPRETPEGIP